MKLVVCIAILLTVGWFSFVAGAYLARKAAVAEGAQILCEEIGDRSDYRTCIEYFEEAIDRGIKND